MERGKFGGHSQAEDGVWGRLCPVPGDGLEFLAASESGECGETVGIALTGKLCGS